MESSILFNCITEVLLIYNIILVSSVQHSDSNIFIDIFI